VRLVVTAIFAVVLPLAGLSAQRPKDVVPMFRPLSVSGEAAPEMYRYSLRAYESCDPTNCVKALLFTPRPVGMNPLPVVVYIPGCGEIGDVSRQFRQRAIFDRVTSAAFQEKYPCFLLAVSPPETAGTMLGGMPDRPSSLQRSVHDFVVALCTAQRRPRADMSRIYITGYSYGGNGAYALAQHFPGTFAAAVPIAALPPLPEYFSKERPGSWWHFHNEGDYSGHGIATDGLRAFAALVNCAGGDFRVGTFPAEGHDAWTTAWREDAVWDWMFSKSLKGPVRQLTKKGRMAEPVSLSLSKAECTASVEGIDHAHGPERAVDGLDATWYESARPFSQGDWWQVDLKTPVAGRVELVSGDGSGGKLLKGAFVEGSVDGRRWTRCGAFSAKDGICSFVSRGKVRFLRVKSASVRSQAICLRRLRIFKDGK